MFKTESEITVRNKDEGQAVRIPADQHHISPNKICDRAKDVVHRLQQAGFEAYLVGGCVRDLLLDLAPKDFDIATSARPEEVRKLFRSCRLIGRRFRLAHIYYGRDYLEVATFRAPHDEQDGGKVSEEGRIIHDNVYGSLEEDVWRRDFTVNALFYNPENGEVIDFVGGLDDLRAGKIQLIGDPEQRFREDPVRLLRAIRFAAKLGFEIDAATRDLIEPLAILLEGVAPARLFDEVIKLLHCGNGQATFQLLREYDILRHLLPLTEESLLEDQSGQFERMLELSLANTDQRIAEGKSVMPAFLYAVLLWQKVHAAAVEIQLNGHPEMQSLHLAASDVLREQVDFTAIPRRLSNITREIWALQPRFRYREWRRANTLLNNQRFRAAYDFMCLRAQAGEDLDGACEWWTTFQQVDEEERQAMCKPARNRKSPRRKRRRRKPNSKSAGEAS